MIITQVQPVCILNIPASTFGIMLGWVEKLWLSNFPHPIRGSDGTSSRATLTPLFCNSWCFFFTYEPSTSTIFKPHSFLASLILHSKINKAVCYN